MNKKLKIFLLTSTAIIVLGIGYILYLFQFKEYEVADEEVDQIMEDPYDVTLPNGKKLILEDEVDKDGNKKEQASEGKSASESEDGETISDTPKDQQAAGSSSTTGSDTSTTSDSGTAATNSDVTGSDQPTVESGTSTSGGNSTTTPNSNATSGNKDSTTTGSATGNTAAGKPGKKESVGEIKGKYEPTIAGLQGQVDSKINALIGRAKSEYSTKKANGESVNYAYFYSKYMSAAEGLEAQTDAVFNGVVNSLEKDLQANGYDKTYSKSVKDEYAAQKKARRDGIMKKAMGN